MTAGAGVRTQHLHGRRDPPLHLTRRIFAQRSGELESVPCKSYAGKFRASESSDSPIANKYCIRLKVLTGPRHAAEGGVVFLFGPLSVFDGGLGVVGLPKAIHLFMLFYGIPCRDMRFGTREPFMEVPREAALRESLPTRRRCFSVYVLVVPCQNL